jgi:hypothetical protein
VAEESTGYEREVIGSVSAFDPIKITNHHLHRARFHLYHIQGDSHVFTTITSSICISTQHTNSRMEARYEACCSTKPINVYVWEHPARSNHNLASGFDARCRLRSKLLFNNGVRLCCYIDPLREPNKNATDDTKTKTK